MTEEQRIQRIEEELDRTQPIACQGCGKEMEIPFHCRPSESPWARRDHYGIYTGIYCDDCFESDKYPYRRDDYYDPGYAGEYMDDDY